MILYFDWFDNGSFLLTICIIADSVGLGKSFEALAVIKYYELSNDRVLVLCPKKLHDNRTAI